jgi:UDP-N-acetylglucosamine 2-epimerase
VHERPEGFEEAVVMFIGLSVERALDALEVLETQPCDEQRALRMVDDYSANNVSGQGVAHHHELRQLRQSRVSHKDT